MEENPINNNPDSEYQQADGESLTFEKIKELETALSSAKYEITCVIEKNTMQIVGVSFICFVLILIGANYAHEIFYYDKFKDTWDWQIIYFTVMRVVVISAFLSVATFMFKLLSSYLNIYQKNLHKKFVLNSMASLVASGHNYTDEQVVFSKLLEIVVVQEKTGIFNKDMDLDNKNSALIDAIKKIVTKGS